MFTKYASATITAHSGGSMGKTAGMKTCGSFEYEPRTDHKYLYVAARACTADVPNLNYDMLPDRELKTAYKSFIGSYVYLNHDNTDPRKARGAIIDAKYHTEDPDDKWIEILMELDEEKAPKLCSLIRSGEIDTVSMGCSVASTDCSICGNNAEYPFEYCEHIQNKGQEYGGKLAYEICNGIDFFEESFVYNPADETAHVKGIDEETKVAKKAAKRQYITVKGGKKTNKKVASKKTAQEITGYTLTDWVFQDDYDGYDTWERHTITHYIDDGFEYDHEYVSETMEGFSAVCEKNTDGWMAWVERDGEILNSDYFPTDSDAKDWCDAYIDAVINKIAKKGSVSKKTASLLDVPLSECSASDFSAGAIEKDYQEIEWFTQTAVDDGISEDVEVRYEYMPVYFRGELLGYVGGAYDAGADNSLYSNDLVYDEPDIVRDFDDDGSDIWREVGGGGAWIQGQEVNDLDSYFTDGGIGYGIIEDMTAAPEAYGLPENPTIGDLIRLEMDLEPFGMPNVFMASVKSALLSSDMRSRLADYVRDAYGKDYAFSVTADGDWFISGKSDFFTDNQTFGCSNGFTNYAKEIDAVMGRYGISQRNGWRTKEPYRDMKWASVDNNRVWYDVDGDGTHWVTEMPSFDEDEDYGEVIEGGEVVIEDGTYGEGGKGHIGEVYACIHWLVYDSNYGEVERERYFSDVESAKRWVEQELMSEYGIHVAAKHADDGTSFADAPRRPESVNSQEENLVCPLCGSDAFDGEYCNICGYQEPPEGFGDIEIETEEDMESYEEVDVDSDAEEDAETEDENEKEAALEKMYDIADDPQYFINVADEEGGDYILIGFDIIKTDDVYVQDALEDAGAIEM